MVDIEISIHGLSADSISFRSGFKAIKEANTFFNTEPFLFRKVSISLTYCNFCCTMIDIISYNCLSYMGDNIEHQRLIICILGMKILILSHK